MIEKEQVLKVMGRTYSTLCIHPGLVSLASDEMSKRDMARISRAMKDLGILKNIEQDGRRHYKWNMEFIPSIRLAEDVIIRIKEIRQEEYIEQIESRRRKRQELRKNRENKSTNVEQSYNKQEKMENTDKTEAVMVEITEASTTEAKEGPVKKRRINKDTVKGKEMVSHPAHYNHFSVECLEMMKRIWGVDAVAQWCEMTEFKYRYRIGEKDDLEQEMGKINFYRYLRKRLYEGADNIDGQVKD